LIPLGSSSDEANQAPPKVNGSASLNDKQSNGKLTQVTAPSTTNKENAAPMTNSE